MKLKIILILLIITACTVANDEQENTAPQLPNVIKQWAGTAQASSSYGGSLGQHQDDQSPYAATGISDVTTCADSNYAWVIANEDDGEHWLELTFDKEVYVSKLRVHETLGPGAITKIELLNDQNYITFWSGRDYPQDCPRWFETKYSVTQNNITKTMTEFKTDTVKLTLDTDTADWNEIDAVELIGYDSIWYLFNNTVVIE